MNDESIMLLGASVRAAAQSCRPAGLDCHGADLFADVDTVALGRFERVMEYPRGLLKFAEQASPSRWMYTGGLENYPELIEAISQRHELLGIGGESLRRVRDPLQLYDVLSTAKLSVPEVAMNPNDVAEKQHWLRKPLRGSGGTNVVSADQGRSSRGFYYQRFVEGQPAAAAFLAHAGGAILLGITHQIIGQPWTGARAFQYAGSIGPVNFSAEFEALIEKIGIAVTEAFALTGLFGIDGVIADDQFWPVEVNPRYTSSIEILERAGLPSAVDLHVRACTQQALSTSPRQSLQPIVHGKAVVFATREVQIGPSFEQFAKQQNAASEAPQIADIPPCGETIPPGRPITTVYGHGCDKTEVVNALRERCEEVRRVCDPL